MDKDLFLKLKAVAEKEGVQLQITFVRLISTHDITVTEGGIVVVDKQEDQDGLVIEYADIANVFICEPS